jgi:hypothetical protein
LQLAGVLVDLAALEAAMRRGAQALHTLAESSLLDEEIGRLPGRSYRLAIAAVVHLARGQPGMSIAALGAYDAHAGAGAGWTRPAAMLGKRAPMQVRDVGVGIADEPVGDPLGVAPQEAGAFRGWLKEAVEETRNRLDPAEVAAATTAARRKTLDELLDELIIQPAKAAA